MSPVPRIVRLRSFSGPVALLLALWGVPGLRAEALLERDVLPVLTKQCLGCHGGLRKRGGLDLRTPAAMLRGGDSGPAVKPGDPEASELWKKITADKMPPGKKKLSAAEKAVIRQWISARLPTVAQRQQKEGPLLAAGRKHSPRKVADAIDRHIDSTLTAAGLKAVPRGDDAEFLRRAYLDLTGCVPTAEQARVFLDDKAPDRRARLIDSLLATPRFGEQLGRTWRDWICPPELPSDGNGGQQPHKEAQNFGKWLGTRFAAGDSWDRITRAVLTVDGDIKVKPQVIFFGLVGEGGRTSAGGSAKAVASLFMGVQMQCAQCHDHPYHTWAQREFWSLAAFFERTTGNFNKISERPASPVKDPLRITIPKSAFKNAGTSVTAAFPGGKPFRPAKTVAPRSAFVDWLTARDNPYFARAFANRMWFYCFSRGVVNPVDDFRDLNPPSHPGLMKLLTNEFADSGFDVKHLLRCICNSRAYQRTSRVPPGTSEQTVAALTDAFGRMPLRVMTADQLYDSLKQAYGDPKLDLRNIDVKGVNTDGMSAPVADAYLEFLRRFGTNKDDATDFTHGIPQMLTMINHPRLLQGSKSLDAYLKSNPTPEQVVEYCYLATLSRRPDAEERAAAQRYLKKAANPARGYVGVLWMLVNRSEYLFVR